MPWPNALQMTLRRYHTLLLRFAAVGAVFLALGADVNPTDVGTEVSIRVCNEGVQRLSIDRRGLIEYRSAFGNERQYSRLTDSQLKQLIVLTTSLSKGQSQTHRHEQISDPFLCDRYLLRVTLDGEYRDYETSAQLPASTRALVDLLVELTAAHFGETTADRLRVVATESL